MHNILRNFFVLVVVVSSLCRFSSLKVLAQQEFPAFIESPEGIVKVSLQGQGEVRVKAGMGLQSGDIVRTEVGARVVLRLQDGTRVELGGDTRLDIAELNLKTQTKSSVFKLVWGRLRAVLAQPYKTPGSEFNVETPNALAGVKFTTFQMGYFRSTETTWLLVEQGTVTLKSLLHVDQPVETVGVRQSAVAVKNNAPQRVSAEDLDQIRKDGREGERKLREEKKK